MFQMRNALCRGGRRFPIESNSHGGFVYKRLLAGICMSIAMSGALATTFVGSAQAAPVSAASKAVCHKTDASAAKDSAPVAVVAHKSDIPADFELSSAAASGRPSSDFVLNPCAEIDLSQVVDCRSGTCYEYCWNRIYPYSRVYCSEDGKYYNRKNWIQYVSGHRGNDCVPGS